ncbi:MAG TPA: DUF4255 domain-containing protein [Phnomibacter sp.]|nr:DUF4255 domain-containing protein [Phnomibacter sp.]
MIDKALAFIGQEVNKYFDVRFGANTEKHVKLGNVARLTDNESAQTPPTGVVFGVVNIEEDRISKSPDNFRKVGQDKIEYIHPKVYLNLYLLFAVNLTSYTETLKHLSALVQFFQHRYLFTSNQNPGLDANIDKLIVELHSLNFEQLNHLWGILGGKYLPSALYKMRVVGIQEEKVEATAKPILEIENELLHWDGIAPIPQGSSA